MSARSGSKSQAVFRRESPEDRRRHLGEAALRSFASHGSAGTAIRLIAAEAGVTPGLITYHFGEIDELIHYAYDLMVERLFKSVTEAVDAAPDSPAARLDAFIEALLSPMIFDRNVLAALLVFYGLMPASQRMRAVLLSEFETLALTVERLIIGLVEEEGFAVRDPRLAAKALIAFLDGLWLNWCLLPTEFTAHDALQQCRYWLKGLRCGAYA